MKTQQITKTGIVELDSDLKSLFELAESSKKQSVQQAIKKRDLPEKALKKLIPLSVMRATYALIDQKNFDGLLEACPKAAHPFLRRAQALAKKEFGELVTNPTVLDILREESQKQRSEDKPSMNLHVISNISSIFQWLGKPPHLVPAIRVGFRDRRNNVLLDSSMDWDDALFLIEGITDLVADQFEQGVSLANANLLDLSDAKKCAKKIRNVQANLRRVLKHAPTYGILVDSVDKSGESEQAITGEK